MRSGRELSVRAQCNERLLAEYYGSKTIVAFANAKGKSFLHLAFERHNRVGNKLLARHVRHSILRHALSPRHQSQKSFKGHSGIGSIGKFIEILRDRNGVC